MLPLIKFVGRWVGVISFSFGKILGLIRGFPSKTNSQNYSEFLPKEISWWQMWDFFFSEKWVGLESFLEKISI